MELARDAPPFFFLRMDQLTAQRLARLFRALAVAHFAPELLVRLDQFGGAFLNESFELPGAIGQLFVRLTQLALRALLFFKKIAELELPTTGIERDLKRT